MAEDRHNADENPGEGINEVGAGQQRSDLLGQADFAEVTCLWTPRTPCDQHFEQPCHALLSPACCPLIILAESNATTELAEPKA